jgi:hypothetical protein
MIAPTGEAVGEASELQLLRKRCKELQLENEELKRKNVTVSVIWTK